MLKRNLKKRREIHNKEHRDFYLRFIKKMNATYYSGIDGIGLDTE